MSHALRKLEKNDTGTWYRMPMSHYYFSRKERAALKRGKVVEKWGARFRLRLLRRNVTVRRYSNAQHSLNNAQH